MKETNLLIILSAVQTTNNIAFENMQQLYRLVCIVLTKMYLVLVLANNLVVRLPVNTFFPNYECAMVFPMLWYPKTIG